MWISLENKQAVVFRLPQSVDNKTTAMLKRVQKCAFPIKYRSLLVSGSLKITV